MLASHHGWVGKLFKVALQQIYLQASSVFTFQSTFHYSSIADSSTSSEVFNSSDHAVRYVIIGTYIIGLISILAFG